jgi:hypothetical protein
VADKRVNVVVRPDFSGITEALERLAAAVGYALDPWQATILRMIYSTNRGEVPCGRPHGELVGPCPKCRAVR